MRLGDLVLEENLVSKQGLQEALESQVVNGGKLGTNLVELGLLQEKDLARLLGKIHNVAFASGEMTPDPQALALVTPAFCDQHDVVPMRVDAHRLSVAVSDPRRIEALDALAFKTGRRVTPVVIPEFRLHQLLRRYTKAFRNVRSIDMNVIRPSKTLGTKQDGPKPMEAAELINDDDFQKLYAQALTGGASESEGEVLEGVIVEEEPSIAPAATLEEPSISVVAARPEPLRTPLSFVEAQAELAKSSDREDIAGTVLRFAVGKWKRALLLSVQGDVVVGWQGLGDGVRPKTVRRIGMVLRGGSTFKLVRDTRSHYVGAMKRDASTAVFYKLLGGDYPQTAVLMPLLVRAKPVHILYVDNGPRELTPPDIGEMLILSQSVGRSYETLVRKRTGG